MKEKIIVILLATMSLFAVSVVTCYAVKTKPSLAIHEVYTSGTGGGVSFWRDCPGKQGERHSMVVFCVSNKEVSWTGTSTSDGCMGGLGYCYKMNPCNGGDWMEAPDAKLHCSPQ